MSDGFVSSTIATQERTRRDIRALGDAIEKMCGVVAANSESLKELLAIQQAHDERETRLTVMCEDITRIANSVVTMVEDMHRANQLLSNHIEQLNLRVSADETLEGLVVKLAGLGVVINGVADDDSKA